MFRTLARLATRIRSTSTAGAVQALCDEAAAAFGARRYAEAARCADRAVTIDPASAPGHFLLGCARLELGACEAAEASFEACLRQEPEYPMVLHAAMCRALSRARAGLAAGRTPRIVRTTAGADKRISVIICSVDPQRFEKVQANYRTLLGSVSHEIIGIHDASSLCEGYNRGAARASGEILVFSHDDIEIVTADFAARLLDHLSRHDLVGVAGATRLIGGSWTYAGWPHLCGQVGSRIMKPGSLAVTVFGLQEGAAGTVQALDGVFLAARREVLERIRFDERTFDGWHLYDLDFSFSAHLAGFRLAVCQDICLIHDSLGTYQADWQRYVDRFEDKHRGRLQKDQWHAQKRCSVEVASAEEWMLMAEEMISPATRATTR